MLNLQHQHNNHTITPHMRVGPSVCGIYHRVKGCCVIVVLVFCKNQIPN
jgi:hypothetical protein